MKDKFLIFLASFAYLGFIPVAPGTFGTLGGVCVYYLLIRITDNLGYMVFLTVFLIFSIMISGYAEKVLGEDDPNKVVIDEVTGFLVTMTMIPFTLINLLIGFLLFRFFDIVKPFPIRRIEKIGGGVGVVLDDVAAGIWANVSLLIILKVSSNYL